MRLTPHFLHVGVSAVRGRLRELGELAEIARKALVLFRCQALIPEYDHEEVLERQHDLGKRLRIQWSGAINAADLATARSGERLYLDPLELGHGGTGNEYVLQGLHCGPARALLLSALRIRLAPRCGTFKSNGIHIPFLRLRPADGRIIRAIGLRINAE